MRVARPPGLRDRPSPMRALHRHGRPLGDPDNRCGACAWSRMRGPGPQVLRCVRAGDARVAADEPACDRFEPALDCLRCGACCREAFDAVEITRRDPVRGLHPALIEEADGRLRIRRAVGNRCAALESDSFHCRIYEDRPRCCRDFEQGGPNCVFARERVGLTQPW